MCFSFQKHINESLTDQFPLFLIYSALKEHMDENLWFVIQDECKSV